jgi:hypothetical protein
VKVWIAQRWLALVTTGLQVLKLLPGQLKRSNTLTYPMTEAFHLPIGAGNDVVTYIIKYGLEFCFVR